MFSDREIKTFKKVRFLNPVVGKVLVTLCVTRQVSKSYILYI